MLHCDISTAKNVGFWKILDLGIFELKVLNLYQKPQLCFLKSPTRLAAHHARYGSLTHSWLTIIPTSQQRKLRHGEVKQLDQGKEPQIKDSGNWEEGTRTGEGDIKPQLQDHESQNARRKALKCFAPVHHQGGDTVSFSTGQAPRLRNTKG